MARIAVGFAVGLLLPTLTSAAPILYPINAEFPVVLTVAGTNPTDAVRITLDIGSGHGAGQIVAPGEPVLAMGWARVQPELSIVAPGLHAPIVVRMSLVSDPGTFSDFTVPLDLTVALHASRAWWGHYVLEGTGLPGAGRFNPVLAYLPGLVGRHELTGTFAVRAYVPEPAMATLLAFAAAAVMARRHRRRRTRHDSRVPTRSQ